MTKANIKSNLGKFGQLIGINSHGYSKTLHGRMKKIDTIDQVLFEDNEGILHLFKYDKIEFEEKKFVALPRRIKGKKIVNLGGQYVYSDDPKKEVDFNK